jgi:hypothetical protein
MAAKKRQRSYGFAFDHPIRRKTPSQSAALAKLRIREELKDMSNPQLLRALNAVRRVKYG